MKQLMLWMALLKKRSIIWHVSEDLTLILVSHRVSSTAFCDNIFFISNGAVEDHGSYRHLKEKNLGFRTMDA